MSDLDSIKFSGVKYNLADSTMRDLLDDDNKISESSLATDTVNKIQHLDTSGKISSDNVYEGSDTTTSINDKLSDIDGLKKDVEELKKSNIIYGFHVNSAESDPSDCVTYLKDAVGMTPAKMNYTNSKFDWGSWENAFFIPRPCMLKTDGTVDYYLDPNNYALKEDGTASDVANVDYDGNAMIEWGRDGKKIWYAIIPDTDPTSYSVYIANYKATDNFHAWSFINKDNEMVNHFYTPCFSGALDSNNKLRSISGLTPMQNKNGTAQISYARANGDIYNIEVWADKTLMFFLLYLMGKSLDLQTTYGQGHTTGGSSTYTPSATGELNTKGLFFGYSSTTQKVKVFGMEDQWGELWNRTAGLMQSSGKAYYKMTQSTADGSSLTDYPTTSVDGMLDGGGICASNGYVTKMQTADGNCILPNAAGGGSSAYYCDYYYVNTSAVAFARLGGSSYDGASCGFSVGLAYAVSLASWVVGAALSCKPLS